jgi:hypothetical protein
MREVTLSQGAIIIGSGPIIFNSVTRQASEESIGVLVGTKERTIEVKPNGAIEVLK